MAATDWRLLFTSFHAVWNLHKYSPDETPFLWRQLLRRALSPARSKSGIEKEAVSFGLYPEFARNWPLFEAVKKAREDNESEGGFAPECPAQCVFQTALNILTMGLDTELNRHRERRWFYRGQRDHRWPTTASIFRDLSPDREKARELGTRTERTRKVVAALRDRDLGKDELESLAIAQHYSKELDVKTWLVDVTESPWVALFFASHGGTTGEIGVLDYIERTEWQKFSDEGKNLSGAIRVVSPFGIPRIENQHAFFIDTPHPEIYRQMSMRQLHFRQRTGVVFEDESFVPPLVGGTIYPQDDPILARLPSDFSTGAVTLLSKEPSVASLSDPTSEAFYAVMRQILHDATELQLGLVETLACPLHAELTRRKQRLPGYIITLHNLRNCVEHIVLAFNDYSSDESIALNLWPLFYIQHLETVDERAAFIESVEQAFPALLPVAEEIIKRFS